jgi:hypothetical protein
VLVLEGEETGVKFLLFDDLDELVDQLALTFVVVLLHDLPGIINFINLAQYSRTHFISVFSSIFL